MVRVLLTLFFLYSSFACLLTSAQRSAEVRALQRALSFYLYFYLSFGVCVSAVCGLCFTDFGQVAFFLQAKISIHINCSRQRDSHVI